VTQRLPILLLVALAGCGSSGDGRIDAHNAERLRAADASQGALKGAARATLSGGRLELVSPSGRWKVSARAGTVRLLDAATGETVDTLVSRIARPSAIAWTRNSETFAVGGKDGRVTVWEEFKHRTYDLPAGTSPVTALAFSPDTRLLVTAQGAGGLRVWELSGPKQVARLEPGILARDLRFSADGRRLFAGNGTRAWQLRLPR
jgi:WD40 repeat protein